MGSEMENMRAKLENMVRRHLQESDCSLAEESPTGYFLHYEVN
jgi:hypothetical protein